MSKPKIYGFNNGGTHGFMRAVAITEEGIGLTMHLCSHEGFMPHDLGMDGQSDWKHEHYDKHYPDGWECEFVSSENFHTHEGLQAALKKARCSHETE